MDVPQNIKELMSKNEQYYNQLKELVNSFKSLESTFSDGEKRVIDSSELKHNIKILEVGTYFTNLPSEFLGIDNEKIHIYSHAIRNSLGPILQILELINLGVPITKAMIGKIPVSYERLTFNIENLFLEASQYSDQIIPQNVYDRIRALYSINIDVEYRLDEKYHYKLSISPATVMEAVSELVLNVAKYAQNEDVLAHMTFSRVQTEEGNFMQISVEDNGLGVNDVRVQNLNKALRKGSVYRENLKSEQEGTGKGLREIKKMGIHINASQSEKLGGFEITLLVPIL